MRLQAAGCSVSIFDAASAPGGRARTVTHHDHVLDNGQHILIGAYERTLALMREVGVDLEVALHRSPLSLPDPDGRGLRLPAGPALPALLLGLLRLSHWPLGARMAWIVRASGWMVRGMRCPPTLTVRDLCRGLPAPVMDDLIEPLCVAALNTDSREASASVFLRVLRDALLGGRGASDLLLPRRALGSLLPEPASRRLQALGAELRWRHRVLALDPRPGEVVHRTWAVDGEAFDAVVLACPPREAARLVRPVAPDWSATAEALQHEPITTLVLEASPPATLGAPMVRLNSGPAQFAFDLSAIGHEAAPRQAPPWAARQMRFTFVISAAGPWLEQGIDAMRMATLQQARAAFACLAEDPSLKIVACFTEKRATFRCTAGLNRPAQAIAKRLWAAGDYVEGPYPATLEGAVRSGEAAAAAVLAHR